MNILLLSVTFPFPPTKGGTEVRTFNLLKQLSKNHSITLLTYRDAKTTDSDIEALKQFVSTLTVLEKPKYEVSFSHRTIKALLSGTPPFLFAHHSKEFQNVFEKAVNSNTFDLVCLEHTANAIFIDSCKEIQTPVLLNAHSSFFHYAKSELALRKSIPVKIKGYFELILRKNFERRICKKLSQVVVTTEEEKKRFLAFIEENKVSVVTNGTDLGIFKMRSGPPRSHKIVFFGAMESIINEAAACELVEKIFPLIQKEHPNVTLDIIGSNPSKKVELLGNIKNVTVTGRVEDLLPYLHNASACVLPVRAGHGIKNKTLEAMAAGVPVIGTHLALEGIPLVEEHGKRLALLAETPSEFAQEISNVLFSESLQRELSESARAYVEKHHTWDLAGSRYEAVIIDTVASK